MTRRKIPKRDKVRMLASVIGVLVVLIGVSFAIRYMELQRVNPQQEVVRETTEPVESTLQYQGETYELKADLKTYLFMGIDIQGPVRVHAGEGGQADFQLLLVVDSAAKTWQMLPINRDTLTDVTVLGVLGDAISVQRQQIALAHAYGDGMRKSCRNAVNAVSHLLGECQIDGYYALNMDGISVLADALGGIPVTIPEDYTVLDPSFTKGAQLTLTGEQAYKLVRTRRSVDDQTNVSRMARQNLVMEGAIGRLNSLTDDDCIAGFNAVADYVMTNLGSAEILRLKEVAEQYQQQPTLQIEGTSSVLDGVMAFEPDADSLQNVIVQLFYTKKEMR